MNDLTISLVQTDIYWEKQQANLSMLEEKIWAIGATDLIVLPEMFTTGFSMNAERLAEPPGGKTFKWMRHMAMQRKVAITGSFIVKEGVNFYNRLYFVKPDGSSVQYDKRHLFNLAKEGDCYTAGNERLVVEFLGWRINPMICYDLRFPVWARSQKRPANEHEYDLLLFVANWPEARIDAWDALLKARAIENMSYCAGVNRVGIDGFNKNYTGHSAVYSTLGQELAFSTHEETMTVILSAKDLADTRTKFPFQQDADDFKLA